MCDWFMNTHHASCISCYVSTCGTEMCTYLYIYVNIYLYAYDRVMLMLWGSLFLVCCGAAVVVIVAVGAAVAVLRLSLFQPDLHAWRRQSLHTTMLYVLAVAFCMRDRSGAWSIAVSSSLWLLSGKDGMLKHVRRNTTWSESKRITYFKQTPFTIPLSWGNQGREGLRRGTDIKTLGLRI